MRAPAVPRSAAPSTNGSEHCAPDSAPSGDVQSNVFSLAMVEGAVRSADSLSRVSLDDVLEDAYQQALRTEQREDVKEVLLSWGSAAARLTAGELESQSTKAQAHD